VLLGVVCQMVAVYLLLYRVSLKPLIKLAMLALIIVVAFGLIGDYRGTQSSLITLVDDRYQNTFQRLPSGFLWFYIYLTSPLSNVVANIDLVQPTYVPYYSIANLIPTVARNVIFPADFVRPDAFQLVVENLNVSTFYAGYLSDFGLAGSILTVALLQLLIVIVYFNAKRKAVWAIIAYAVFFQCLVFSVFYNLLSSQVYVMQIVLALYFGGTVKRLTRHPAITRPASGSTPTEYRQPALHSQ
jgi:oligosaccharide repeat unit polymerase